MNNVSNLLDECESFLQKGDLASAIMKLAHISFQYKKYEDYVFLRMQLVDTGDENSNNVFLMEIKKEIPNQIDQVEIIKKAAIRYENLRRYCDNMFYSIPVNIRREHPIKLSEIGSSKAEIERQQRSQLDRCFLNIENEIRAIILQYRNASCAFVNNHDYSMIVKIIDHFGNIARQLTKRHDKRPTIEINDEYDVQDLFHALLRLHFDDIRAEEWTPSYAGGASRIDFLIKKLQLAIEIKFASAKLRNKELKEQLSVDKEQYKSHPDAKKLLCFIYDPNYKVDNPRGFEEDLRQDSPLKTEIFVRN